MKTFWADLSLYLEKMKVCFNFTPTRFRNKRKGFLLVPTHKTQHLIFFSWCFIFQTCVSWLSTEQVLSFNKCFQTEWNSTKKVLSELNKFLVSKFLLQIILSTVWSRTLKTKNPIVFGWVINSFCRVLKFFHNITFSFSSSTFYFNFFPCQIGKSHFLDDDKCITNQSCVLNYTIHLHNIFFKLFYFLSLVFSSHLNYITK